MQVKKLINKCLSNKTIMIIYCLNIVLVCFFIAILLFVFNTTKEESYSLVVSKSIDKTLLHTKKAHNVILQELKNKIVIINKTTAYSNNGIPYIAKYVKCIEGEYLKVTKDKKYFCNGEYLGFAQNKNSKGESVQNFVFNGVIPQGKFFAMGTHLMSYDSRYFGFVDKNKITRYEI